MKINLDFYKSDICVNEISSNTVKSQINQIIKDAEDFEYESAINTEDINNEVFNSISSIRKNIINWYDFKVTDRVLEINLDNGIITDFLCQKFNHVTSVCFDYNHFELIKDKLEKYDNLEVIIGALDDINFDEKYDYILLFNCYENHYKFYNKKDQILLKYLSNLLKKEGTILLAIDNPVSVKRLVGGIDTYGYNSLSMFTGFTKDKLVKQLNENGFKYNFYYPLPDYKMTSVIFSDRYLPDVNNSKLLYNFNYEYPSNILANEHVYLIESNIGIKKYVKRIIYYNVTYYLFIGYIFFLILIFNFNISSILYRVILYFISFVLIKFSIDVLWKMWITNIKYRDNVYILKIEKIGNFKMLYDTGNFASYDLEVPVIIMNTNKYINKVRKYKKYIQTTEKVSIYLKTINGKKQFDGYIFKNIILKKGEMKDKKITKVIIVFTEEEIVNNMFDGILPFNILIEK